MNWCSVFNVVAALRLVSLPKMCETVKVHQPNQTRLFFIDPREGTKVEVWLV